ncbi:glycosyltransferase family 2 protein [Paenibacillus athensensis]|nr:glycosyltransferase family 2 protein [Paenibacillus athensensis]MCD1259243.1 glycosyltransferase family 2 protein [Paenibacillus athensensis]
MGQEVKVSIIVIVSDTEKHLEKCLDSLVHQTIKQTEIIVVDDCSINDPRTILEKYYTDERVQFIRLDSKKGPGGARNKGLSLSTGTYIGFCDSDDWLDLNFYETAVNFMEQESADVGTCGLVRNYDVELQEKVYKCKYDSLIPLNGETAFKIMTKQYDYGIHIVPSSVNKIYKREFILQHNLFFLEHVYYEDLLFSFKMMLNAKKVICIPSTYYHHYKRIGSIVQSFSQKHIDDFYEVFLQIRKYLKENHLYERYQFNYYKFGEQFYNLIIRQMFEYVHNEEERKSYMRYSFSRIKELIEFEEYLEYATAEKLRQHIQPHLKSTTIY